MLRRSLLSATGGLALTASDDSFRGLVPLRGISAHALGATVVHVDETCLAAIGGRRAARVVTDGAKRFGLTEAEFQILWRLRSAPEGGFDQTALAKGLAFSPAQISASVERLQSQGRICSSGQTADRRRRLWQLSLAGRELLDQMLVATTLTRSECVMESPLPSHGGDGQEAAA